MPKYNSVNEELEDKIYNYFKETFEEFLAREDYTSFKEAQQAFTNELASPFKRSFYADNFFEPELGISLKLLLSTLKENTQTFEGYINNILNESGIESDLARDGFRFKENTMKLNEGLFDTDSDDTKATDEEIRKAKSAIIKKSLGVENFNTDTLEDDELDTLLAKVTTINEKVDTIIKKMCGCGHDKIARAIAKYTGLKLNEAKEIIEDYYD